MRKILLLFLLTLTVSSWGKPAKNIILILADDLGWADTTLYGKTSLYETPNIQRLAKRGMIFSNAYASPICSPTRASILTGQNPARHGMTSPAAHLPEVRLKPAAQTVGRPDRKSTNIKTATRIDPAVPTLGEILKEAGYATAHFGKWHLGMKGFTPLEHGFDMDLPHWHGPGPKTGYLAPWGYPNPAFPEGAPGQHIEDRMAKEAVTWLKNRDRTKPFFINYWQFSVHAPFGAKPEFIERYRKKIKHGEKQQSPTYAAMVHSLDEAVGTLLDALDNEGVADETIIVFYSDNGGNIHCGLEETDAAGEKYITAITTNHPLRGGKGGIHEGGIRVPAVVVWPGVTKPDSRNDTRIQANDLYPTILRMLNLKHPEDHVIDGVDFSNALSGQKMERKPMFTYVPSHGNTPQWLPPSMAVHHGDWKFIRTFHYGEDGKHQYRLYNLRNDIGENHNVAKLHPERVKVMDQWITDYLAEAKVVVPLPNPKFDPAKFDPATIGVQKGGLKMPRAKKKPGDAAPAATVSKKLMLGWIARNADVTAKGDLLEITAAGRRPYIANAKIRVDGPAQVRLQIRIQKDGEGRLQWRTADQKNFPATGQSKTFTIKGGDWRELTVPLLVKGQLLHSRLFLPSQKQPVQLDWIEIGPTDGKANETKRWDFKAAKPFPEALLPEKPKK
jgi:arylsulfatase A-like enzyme